MRLAEIDAPGKGQPFAKRSKQALSLLCFGAQAVVSPGTKDRYGRIVERVECRGVRRSVMWMHIKDRRSDLFANLLKGEGARIDAGRATRLEVGSTARLIELRDISRTCAITLRVFVVQPDLSKAAAAEHQLALLGVTEKFVMETYQLPLFVYCS